MTAQQLKNSILQMAVQGKLVPQDPNDEPASVLLERIRTEKERLIREKKIKREKNPSVIFRGADNIPYEKVGDAITPLEVPFEIPETWEWARIRSLGEIIRGSGIKRTETTPTGMPCVRYGELYTTYQTSFIETVSFIPESLYDTCKPFSYGDILMTLTGENKPDIAKAVAYMGNKPVAAGGDLAFWTRHGMNPLFLTYLMASPYVINRKISLATGDIIVHISGDKLGSILIPVPPLNEQDRIVEQILKAEVAINEYSIKENELQSLQASFQDRLQKAILQQAVQGKLVPQDPADEPAEVLLERIRAEKQQLVRAGKIKKDKHESVIFRRDNSHYELVDGVERCIDVELPFEIPESWCWSRIGDIFSLQAGKNIQASEIKETVFDRAFRCYGGNGIRGYVNRYNRDGDYPIIGRQGALCGNINRATGRFYATEHAVCVETFCDMDVGWTCLFLSALNLNQYATATAQPGLAVAKINQVFIPVPPLSEQCRIVEKIEELLPLIQSI